MDIQSLMQEEINKEHNPEKATPQSLNVIGEAEVEQAMKILLKYKNDKQGLEQALRENEIMWRMAHWSLSESDDTRIKPKSAWLVNTIINKHADAMDNYPEANILPRARDDEETAKVLSKVVPVILDQTKFEEAYSREQYYKEKNGTGVFGVFWDEKKDNGLGNIVVKYKDLGNLYWKKNVNDIQDSPNFFEVQLMDNDVIKSTWPDVDLSGGDIGLAAESLYGDEHIDTSEQTPVIDWYYKKHEKVVDDLGIEKLITKVHYCKFCNGKVLYASENDPKYAESGWYNHGLYPYEFDVLFPMENCATGFGYIDMIKDDQMFIDKMQQAFLENTAWNATPRVVIRQDSNLNEEEFLDTSKKVIHTTGNLAEDAFRQLQPNALPPIYESIYLEKIQEMKDTSGNTASSQGQASNVTSASGIASLQEASGKLSRDSNKTSYRAFQNVVYMVIELIRQFYTEPRMFRITNDMGQTDYVSFDNRNLLPQPQIVGSRLPILDIEVKPQKKNAYSKEAQNQTAINLYNMGFFAPNNADASLACLDMMDFDGIEKVKENVAKNQTLFDIVMQLQAKLAMLTGGALAPTDQGMPTEEPSAPRRAVQDSKGSLSSQAAAATRGSASPT